MKKTVICPHCGKPYSAYRNPTPTTDVIIHHPVKGIVIIKRANVPHGFALPGGFVEEGEQVEKAAIREMREETGLAVHLKGLLGVYSTPYRDPRQHTMSVVFVGEAQDADALKAGDDAAQAQWWPLDDLPSPIVFDHQKIISDFKDYLAGARCLAPIEEIKD